MALFLRIDSDDIESWLASHFGAELVQPNLIPPNNDLGVWLVEYTSGFELREATLEFERSSGGLTEDYALCTHHFLNLTGGTPDATWTTGDYEAVETALVVNMWGALDGHYDSSTILRAISWRADGPAFKPFGASLQPVLRRTAVGATGSSSSSAVLPPQVAVTITERTDAHFTVSDVEGVGTQVRNRWGRVYLPAPTADSGTYYGRVHSSFATDLADAYESAYNALVAEDLIPVMYSPTTGHAWTITEVSVDDIFDVIRSRRFAQPSARETRAIDAP